MLPLTPSCFHYAVYLLTCVHCTEVEKLNHRTSFVKLGGVVWRRGELLQDSPSDTSSRLFHSNYRAVAKVTLYEENHLFVTHQDLISANII